MPGDYFEVRYENPQNNKRYFYQLDGEGLRYMLLSFLKAIGAERSKSRMMTYGLVENPPLKYGPTGVTKIRKQYSLEG